MERGSFNKKYAQSVSKADFVKQHEHLKEQFDLGNEWEDLQEKKKPKGEKQTTINEPNPDYGKRSAQDEIMSHKGAHPDDLKAG